MDTNTPTGTEKNVQDEIKESVHRIWLAGLGALAAAEEEGGKVFSRLVERGRDVESKGKVEVDKMKSDAERFNEKVKAKAETTFEGWGDKLDEKLTATLRRLGVPPGRGDPQPDAEGRGAQRQDRAAQAAGDSGRSGHAGRSGQHHGLGRRRCWWRGPQKYRATRRAPLGSHWRSRRGLRRERSMRSAPSGL